MPKNKSITYKLIFLLIFLIVLIACGAKKDTGSGVNSGSAETVNLELTIDGDGLFVFKGLSGNVYYSRHGLFLLDDEGYLINNNGYRLQGYDYDDDGVQTSVIADINIDGPISVINVSPDGIVTLNTNFTVSIAQIVLAKFISPQNLSNTVNFICEETETSGQPIITSPENSGTGTIQSGVLEGDYECNRGNMLFNKSVRVNGNGYFRLIDNSTILYTREFPLGTDKHGYLINQSGYRVTGYQAGVAGEILHTIGELNIAGNACGPNATSLITLYVNLDSRESVVTGGFNLADPGGTSHFVNSVIVYDSLGNEKVIDIYFTKISADGWEWNAVVNAAVSYSTLTEIQANGILDFTVDGKLDLESPLTYPTGGFDFEGGASQDQYIDIDFGASVSEGGSGLNGTTQFEGSSAEISQSQDGYPAGNLLSVSFASNGLMTGHFSNNKSKAIGQFILATFPNPGLLVEHDEFTWEETPGSGTPSVNTPGATGYGTVEVTDTD